MSAAVARACARTGRARAVWRAGAVLAVVCVAGAGGVAHAHDFTPGVLSVVERSPGRYAYTWTAPVDSGVAVPVTVSFPQHCRERAAGELDCGARGIAGEVVLHGLGDHRARVVVVLSALDAPPSEHVVDGRSPRVTLGAPAERTFGAWVLLGLEHIALGWDHLAFVIGLLLVAGADRRALVTVSAFTVAHSVTLALASLDVVRLASAPVEATIAASVVLVARESLSSEPTWTRRAPWVVALVFGLVHGLGFAGALRSVGLPQGSLATSLVGFNVGVELGQLAVVALAMVASRLVARPPRWVRPALAYVIGCLGAGWAIARVATIAATW